MTNFLNWNQLNKEMKILGLKPYVFLLYFVGYLGGLVFLVMIFHLTGFILWIIGLIPFIKKIRQAKANLKHKHPDYDYSMYIKNRMPEKIIDYSFTIKNLKKLS